MSVLDILTAPWAIQPEKLLEIQAIYEAHLRGDRMDFEAAFKEPTRATGDLEIVDGVALIPLDGILVKRAGPLQRICGMTGTASVLGSFRTALEDPGVQAILFRVDSPGGSVDGTQELAQAIYEARGRKPMAALAEGCMCSAAYWIGSAAGEVFLSSDTTVMGSIGVVATHVDISSNVAQSGRKVTEITAGRYKRAASPYSPLSEEGLSVLQGQVDHIYEVFVDQVSAFRDVSPNTVLERMADGRVFLGRQAIQAGLADGFSTLDALIDRLSSTSTPNSKEITMTLTREEIQAQAPDLLNAFHQEGADAERARIQGVLGASLPGHEALVQRLAFDGRTTPGEAAVQVLQAEKARKQAVAEDIARDGAAPVPPSLEADPTPASPSDFADRIKALVAEKSTKGIHLTAAQAAAILRQEKE